MSRKRKEKRDFPNPYVEDIDTVYITINEIHYYLPPVRIWMMPSLQATLYNREIEYTHDTIPKEKYKEITELFNLFRIMDGTNGI